MGDDRRAEHVVDAGVLAGVHHEADPPVTFDRQFPAEAHRVGVVVGNDPMQAGRKDARGRGNRGDLLPGEEASQVAGPLEREKDHPLRPPRPEHAAKTAAVILILLKMNKLNV